MIQPIETVEPSIAYYMVSGFAFAFVLWAISYGVHIISQKLEATFIAD